MDDAEKKRLTIAFAIAQADDDQVDRSDMGMLMWQRHADAYLVLADAVIEALDQPVDDELISALAAELARTKG